MTNDISPPDLCSCVGNENDQPDLNPNKIKNNELHRISPDAQKRIQYLIHIQNDHDELKAQFYKDRGALEAKYEELYRPLYDKRYNMVSAIGVNTERPETTNEDERGIPDFWLYALKAHCAIGEYIQRYDEEALKHLENIKWLRTENLKGFKLEFYFRQNPFFKNSVLTVTYHMLDEDELLIDKIVGMEIEWYPENRLTERRSFFDLFIPLEVDSDYKGRVIKYVLQGNYLLGSMIRNYIISRAIVWFTGEQARLEQMEITTRHSRFLRNLSQDVQKRVDHLRNIQRDFDGLKAQFYQERAELEAKFQRLYDKIYNERCAIVNGVVEAELGFKDSEAVNDLELASQEKGVPNFWYHALVNHDLLDSEITVRDGEALKYLTDIKWSRKNDFKGFMLEFRFKNNPFFRNSVLTKTYQFLDYDETILYEAIGMKIEWYPENCLTKERESFFNFFDPLQIDEWAVKELREDMSRDCYIGSTIRNQIILRAVLWYLDEAVSGDKVVGITDSETDESIEFSDDEDDESESEEGEDDESESEEDEDDESEDEEDEDDESEDEDNKVVDLTDSDTDKYIDEHSEDADYASDR